jgi:hypothetical protein
MQPVSFFALRVAGKQLGKSLLPFKRGALSPCSSRLQSPSFVAVFSSDTGKLEEALLLLAAFVAFHGGWSHMTIGEGHHEGNPANDGYQLANRSWPRPSVLCPKKHVALRWINEHVLWGAKLLAVPPTPLKHYIVLKKDTPTSHATLANLRTAPHRRGALPAA